MLVEQGVVIEGAGERVDGADVPRMVALGTVYSDQPVESWGRNERVPQLQQDGGRRESIAGAADEEVHEELPWPFALGARKFGGYGARVRARDEGELLELCLELAVTSQLGRDLAGPETGGAV